MTPDVRQIAYIVGMPRAGTTSLYHNLGSHPDLMVPFRRKTNFFCLHADKPVSWFLDHFEGLDTRIGIDTATLHFVDRDLPTLRRIHEANPDAKVMLFVRRPADWAWSFYRQIATFDAGMPTFETFLAGRYTLQEDGQQVPFTMRDGDIEARIVEARARFGRNLLLADFNLFATNLLDLLTEIERFLGVRSHFDARNIARTKINATSRGNIVAIQRLLRSEMLIAALRALPRPLVTGIRRTYDMSAARLGSNRGREAAPDLEVITRHYFASDDAFVRRLFSGSQILKDGAP